MYGAIYGDIIGSRFEFDRGPWTKEFELFKKPDDFTDDSVMTIAIGDALLEAGKDASIEEIKCACINMMIRWGHKYPDAGYGGRFWGWLFNGKKSEPYNSFGNGSAMRVSAAGWLYDSLERTREVARATAEVTHNHPEGIKGAECTAAVIYMARTGKDKLAIANYVKKEFGYDIDHTVDELRPLHKMDETCMDALPKALISFMEGDSYEDVVRNAVSLGGDTDTIAAIAGSMAEAMYGISVEIAAEGNTYLPLEFKEVLYRFNVATGRVAPVGEENNEYIKKAVSAFLENRTNETLAQLLFVLAKRIEENGQVTAPFVDVNNVITEEFVKNMEMYKEFSFGQNLVLQIDKMKDGDGQCWLPLFTDEEEIEKGECANVRMNITIKELIKSALNNENVNGIVINPFGRSLTLGKEVLKLVFELEY